MITSIKSASVVEIDSLNLIQNDFSMSGNSKGVLEMTVGRLYNFLIRDNNFRFARFMDCISSEYPATASNTKFLL